MLQARNLRIDLGNQLGCVHAGQCNSTPRVTRSTTMVEPSANCDGRNLPTGATQPKPIDSKRAQLSKELLLNRTSPWNLIGELDGAAGIYSSNT